MKIAVTGHRSYGDRLGFYKRLDEMHQAREISGVIVTYTAGPCKFAREWCERNGVDLKQMEPDRTIDFRANMRRQNEAIVTEMRPDLIIVVGDVFSVQDIERRAHAAGIEIMEIRVG